MSLETSIANLVAIGGQNLTLPQQIANAAQDKLAEMAAAYQGHLSSLLVAVSVDQVNGLDTNAGTAAAPLKTLQKALSLTPRGGMCVVTLLGDYTLTADVAIDGKKLCIYSGGGAKKNIYFDRFANNAVAPAQRNCRKFTFRQGGALLLFGCTVNVPVLDATYNGLTAASELALCGGIGDYGADGLDAITLQMYLCDYKIPATPYCCMLPASMPIDLVIIANTLNGAITSLNGQVMSGITAAGGTAASGVSLLRTNLSTI